MAKTRLTKALREEIHTNVMAATNFNKQKADITKRTSELMRTLVKAQVPQEFFDMIEGRPKEWFRYDSTGYLETDVSPLCAMEDDSRYNFRYIAYEPIPVPANFCEKIDASRFAKLLKEAQDWKKRYDAACAELTAYLNSCGSVEDIVERTPELAKHIPTTQAQYKLPVANTNNLFSLLTKAGFDTTVEAA